MFLPKGSQQFYNAMCQDGGKEGSPAQGSEVPLESDQLGFYSSSTGPNPHTETVTASLDIPNTLSPLGASGQQQR